MLLLGCRFFATVDGKKVIGRCSDSQNRASTDSTLFVKIVADISVNLFYDVQVLIYPASVFCHDL